jgi:hypothetical protein
LKPCRLMASFLIFDSSVRWECRAWQRRQLDRRDGPQSRAALEYYGEIESINVPPLAQPEVHQLWRRLETAAYIQRQLGNRLRSWKPRTWRGPEKPVRMGLGFAAKSLRSVCKRKTARAFIIGMSAAFTAPKARNRSRPVGLAHVAQVQQRFGKRLVRIRNSGINVPLRPSSTNNRIAFLARLLPRKLPVLKFAFGFEPIVQFTVGMFPVFKIDFICTTSNFLVTRQALYLNLKCRRRRRGCFGLLTCTSLWLR